MQYFIQGSHTDLEMLSLNLLNNTFRHTSHTTSTYLKLILQQLEKLDLGLLLIWKSERCFRAGNAAR